MEDRIQKYLALAEKGPQHGPAFSVSGEFTADGGVHVDEVGSLTFSYVPRPLSDYDLFLYDVDGAEIAWNMLQRESLHVVPPIRKGWKPGDSLRSYSQTTSRFNANVPQIEGGVTLAIERDGVRLWTRHAPEELPVITDLRGEIVDNVARLQWTDNVAADSPEYRVRGWFENAEGANGGLTSPEYANGWSHRRNQFEINLTELPAGSVSVSIMLEIGFYSTKSDLITLLVPKRPVVMELTKPTASYHPDSLGQLEIHAFASAFGGVRRQITDSDVFAWTIDGRPAGNGAKLTFDPPAIGHHTATAVLNWRGQQVSGSVTFEITKKLLSDLNQTRIVMRKHFRLDPPSLRERFHDFLISILRRTFAR